jgi:hypothetical protein
MDCFWLRPRNDEGEDYFIPAMTKGRVLLHPRNDDVTI